MLDKLKEIEQRYNELSDLLADPKIVQDHSRYSEIAREHANLEELIGPYKQLKGTLEAIEENEAMLDEPDPEMKAMVREELDSLREKTREIEHTLKLLLMPKDPNDDKDVILEIRAGTGGEEAGLFAADLFRMYTRYAEGKGWGIEVLSVNETGIGGFKEIIAGIKGRGAYSRFKFEMRRSSCPEGSGNGSQRQDPYLCSHGRCPPRGRRGRSQYRTRGLEDRYVPVIRRRRPARQQDRVRGANYPYPHRDRRVMPGREVPAQEQGKGHEGIALQDPSEISGRPRPGHCIPEALPGRHRRPERAYPYI